MSEDRKKFLVEDTLTTVHALVASVSGRLLQSALRGYMSEDTSKQVAYHLRRAADLVEKRAKDIGPG